MERGSSGRGRLAGALAGALALAAVGCPGEKQADKPPPPEMPHGPPPARGPAAPQVELRPGGAPAGDAPATPADAARREWETLVGEAGDWPRQLQGLAKRKDEAERLFAPFRAPSASLERLALLVRFTPEAEADGRVGTLQRPLRLLVGKSQLLDPHEYPPEAPRTTALLALMNPGFLASARLVRGPSGWQNLREALASGALDPASARELLGAVRQARSGEWAAAEPRFLAWFLALGERTSQGTPAAGDWPAVASAARSGSSGALEGALRAWVGHFLPPGKATPDKGAAPDAPPPPPPGKGPEAPSRGGKR